MAPEQNLDALIVGAGFGGIYQLKLLLDQGLKVKVIDAASDVGGTWYWNRYPGLTYLTGATSDTEAYLYRYSWDKADLQSYPWARHYVQQAEVLAYLQHIVKRHNLRGYFQFDSEMTGATWDEDTGRWLVKTSQGDVFKTRYLITALGLLSKPNFPAIKGLQNFKGDLIHTARWPSDYQLEGKRVGVIGNGSTGVQLITAIAPQVKQLLCFQRHPQYTVPSGDREVDPEYRKDVNERYDEIWDQVRNSGLGFEFSPSRDSILSATPEEREERLERFWQLGGGFRFMFGAYGDVVSDKEANDVMVDFLKRKIRTIVTDSGKAERLMPTQMYARRPLCDAGYYEQFNRENVDIINLQQTPIHEISGNNIVMSDGKLYELDAIVCATGFDVVDGSYARIAIEGRGGETLQDHWAKDGPTSYLGVAVPNFPNLLMICGPQCPFANFPPVIEEQVRFISNLIKRADKSKADANGAASDNSHGLIEATPEAEEEWGELVDKLTTGSLFRQTGSWIFGVNVEGKRPSVLFYFGGLKGYRDELQKVVDDNYKGFKPF